MGLGFRSRKRSRWGDKLGKSGKPGPRRRGGGEKSQLKGESTARRGGGKTRMGLKSKIVHQHQASNIVCDLSLDL